MSNHRDDVYVANSIKDIFLGFINRIPKWKNKNDA